ncbi:hypothetical protein CBL_05609 [Carabus blaptoides fortunei]
MCLWSFLSKQEIIQITEIKRKRETIQIIDDKINQTFSKGSPRFFFRELMFSVLQFSYKYNFNIDQTGALLSMFYNTHLHFIKYILSQYFFATVEVKNLFIK